MRSSCRSCGWPGARASVPTSKATPSCTCGSPANAIASCAGTSGTSTSSTNSSTTPGDVNDDPSPGGQRSANPQGRPRALIEHRDLRGVVEQFGRTAACHLRVRGQPGDELVAAEIGSGIGGQLREGVARRPARPDTEVGVDVRPHRLEDIDVRGERRPLSARRRVDERGVLEMLRADADQHVPAAADVTGAGHHRTVVVENDRADRGLDAVGAQAPGQEVHRGRTDEARHEHVGRIVVELLGCADLLHVAAAQDHHAIAEGHRLGLVVGHVDGRGAQSLLQLRDLGPHLHTQLRVEIRQRLVHQERLGRPHDRASHRDTLPLTTGEIRRLAIEVLTEIEDARGLVDLRGHLILRHLRECQWEGDVLAHRHVRVERVALEHHGDVAVLRRTLVDPLATDPQFTPGDVLEPGDHVERRRLTAARRTHQDHELAVGDLDVDPVYGGRAVGILLGDVVQNDVCHGLSLHGAGGQAGHDSTLEEEHEDDDGDGDDHRGGRDRPGGFLELRCAGEVRDGDRGGDRAFGRGQRQGQQEVVPGEDEHQDRGGHDAGRREGGDDLAERLPWCGAVHLGGLLQLPRDLAEERGEGVDRQRQREGDVRQDQARPRVEQPESAFDVEQRCDEGDLREHRDQQRGSDQELLAREVQARHRIRGHGAQDDRDHRGDEPDTDRVDQGRGEGTRLEDAPIVVEGELTRPELAVGHAARRLERQADDPEQRDECVQDHQDVGDRPPRLGLSARIQRLTSPRRRNPVRRCRTP
ncbi:phenol hydroxylase [Gordonia terrae C-6]|uniref:Phenol hydroxylase n=1 Tax=Gordonia terrae C-6 TaxID=1316928 RepID=R7Y8S1_9ACTN|nr:phenol hydroxylase [Gordonia terrae C-6]